MRYSGTTLSHIFIIFSLLPPVFGQQQQAKLQTQACTAETEKRIDADIRIAFQMRNENDYQRALNLLLADRDAALPGCRSRERLFSQIAVTQFRMGNLAASERTVRDILASTSHRQHPDSSPETGLAHFLLAGIYSFRADYASAEREYQSALKIMLSLGHAQMVSVAQIYGDMALLYLRTGNIRASEEALQNSIAAEKNCDAVPLQASILRRDALIHIHYHAGRLTGALNASDELVRDHGEDPSLPLALRAHLFRDRGELALAARKLDTSVQYLKRSLSMTAPNTLTPEYGTALAILAVSYRMQNKLPEAAATLAEAAKRAEAFQGSFPQSAAAIYGAYGSVLNRQKQWNKAHPLLVSAVKLSEPDTQLETAALKNLIAADRHLHKRDEESSSRYKLKELLQNPHRDPVHKNTIDVLAFSGPSAH